MVLQKYEGKGEINGYEADRSMMMKMGVKVEAEINGKPVKLKNLHCSYTANGFDHAGNWMFNKDAATDYSAIFANQVEWKLYILSTGNEVQAVGSSASGGSPPYHQTTSDLVTANGSGNWTGGKALIANTASPATNQIVAAATWTAVAYLNTDQLRCNWRWIQSTQGDGDWFNWLILGDLPYDGIAATGNAFDDISLRKKSDLTEWKRSAATYSRTSATVHVLTATFTPDATNPRIGSLRLYNEGIADNYCFIYTATEVIQPVSGDTITVTITFTLSQGSA